MTKDISGIRMFVWDGQFREHFIFMYTTFRTWEARADSGIYLFKNIHVKYLLYTDDKPITEETDGHI